jgi:hypothetical protein
LIHLKGSSSTFIQCSAPPDLFNFVLPGNVALLVKGN